MANSTIEITAEQATKYLSARLTVRGIKRFTWRVKVALWLMNLAAWVMPIKTDVALEVPNEKA